jgi:hypothetical protein
MIVTDEHEAPEPRRPRSLDPMDLGFTPRRPVPWLAPFLLLSTGLRALLAVLFGAYLDKRELQNSLKPDVHSQLGTGGELWLDYVADLGDGFHSTYTIAYLLAQPSLEIGDQHLPRGRVLVMGGDQVYPTASASAYEDRCKGPYAAALPNPQPGVPPPTLYAVPGNHDWYDGLTAFLRLFVRVRSDNIGAWRIEQSRSYFVVELPQRWWLFAIDEQSGAYLDDPQLIYFQDAAKRLLPGDKVILAAAQPTWVKAATKPEAYDTIDYFVRTIIAPTGARVPLMLSGDLHHYARYAGERRQLITCGGGGAYLSATHRLPERITVPPKDAITRKKSPSQPYELAGRYPSEATSRRLSWAVFGRLPFRNPGFVTMLGLIHTLLMLAIVGAATRTDEVVRRLFSVPLGIMVLVVLAGAVLFAQPPSASTKRHMRHWLLGLGHGFAHLGLGALGAWAWLHLPFAAWPWPLPLVAAAVLYGPVAGLAAAQLTSLYLLVASQFGVNVNELFAGQGIDDYKIFLRLHFAANGDLTIYPIAVDRVGRQWRAQPDAPVWASWLVPKEPLRPYLAEKPITLR